MEYYLKRFVGKYRVIAEIDRTTNDFCRNSNGDLCNNTDIFIKCRNGVRVYHYGNTTLVAYIPSIKRGMNIINTLKEELPKDGWAFDSIIKKISMNDKEMEFMFHSKYMELLETYLKPQVSCASMSPFSRRNLPKNKDYVIPEMDLLMYKNLIANVPQENKLAISRITRAFISTILPKNKEYKNLDLKADMKLKMLKEREYIHSLGSEVWESYIDYLSSELEKQKGEN